MTKLEKAEGPKRYTLELMGMEVHKLLNTLKTVAVESSVYADVEEAVLLHTIVHAQARAQGFGRDIEQYEHRVFNPEVMAAALRQTLASSAPRGANTER